jgi:hypothetical protein
MTTQIWLAILSSSLLSGVFGALIAGAFNLRQKQNEYSNEYYKLVLQRRIQAYDDVEQLVINLKAAILDTDNRPYHLLFSRDDDWEDLHKLIFSVMSKGLWLTPKLFSTIREFNLLAFNDGQARDGLIEFGKRNYTTIAKLRESIERQHASDMLKLHDVPSFLRLKRRTKSAFEPIVYKNRIIEEA